ncbi:MAG: polyprenyl synthetase family protein [Bacteroidota bacterium]
MTQDERFASYARRLKAVVDERIDTVILRTTSPDLRAALQYCTAGGKRVRPVVAMLSCAAAGGRDLDALDVGVAVELLHTASLVHDDIMDRSETRRGRQAAHVKFGTDVAILVGDVLTALAFTLAHEFSSPRKDRVLKLFSHTFLTLCEGQAEDLAFAKRGMVRNDEHESMVQKKTAELMEVAAGMGALVASDEEQRVRCLRCFGMYVGMAFQALDDVLDVVGDEQILGKPVGADARNARRTFVSMDYGVEVDLSEASNRATQYTDAACSSLEALGSSPARDCLVLMAQSLLKRMS